MPANRSGAPSFVRFTGRSRSAWRRARARDVVKSLGYSEAPLDYADGFALKHDYLDYIASPSFRLLPDHDGSDRLVRARVYDSVGDLRGAGCVRGLHVRGRRKGFCGARVAGILRVAKFNANLARGKG